MIIERLNGILGYSEDQRMCSYIEYVRIEQLHGIVPVAQSSRPYHAHELSSRVVFMRRGLGCSS